MPVGVTLPRGLLLAAVWLMIGALTGCAAMGPKYVDVAPTIPALSPDTTRIILLREQQFLYLALDARVEINGRQIGSLSIGSFTYVDHAPGQVNISVDNWSFPGKYVISVNLKPNGEYYFDVSPRSESFGPVVFGGYIGSSIDAQVNQNSGAFKVVPISKEAASQKLPALSFTQ